MSEQDKGKIESWCIVEIFGHTKLAGFVRSVALGTSVMLRIEVPEITYKERDYNQGGAVVDRTIAAFTKFYSPASIFSITPVTEDLARKAMASWHVEPISYFELKALPAPDPIGIDDPEDAEFEDALERRDGY